MACIRGWRRWVENRRQVKVTIEDTDSSTVCPVSGTSSHNSQDRPRQSLATVWLHAQTSLLIPITGSTSPVVHVHGLIGSRKAICESRLGYIYTQVLGVTGQYESVALILSHKMDFNCCANIRTVFTNPVTYNYLVGNSVLIW